MKAIKQVHPKYSKEQEAAILKKIIDKYKKDVELLVYKNPPLIAAAKVVIEAMKRRGILDLFLKETKYELFQWCLEHDNLELTHKLIEFCSERRRFLMVSDNDYSVFRKYVSDILLLSSEEYAKVSPIKCAILKEIIVINPLYICELIEKILEENKKQAVAITFSQDLQKIALELNSANEDRSSNVLPQSFSEFRFFSSVQSEEKAERKETEEKKLMEEDKKVDFKLDSDLQISQYNPF